MLVIMLKSIAGEGIVPVFSYWATHLDQYSGYTPGGWASTDVLADYVRSVTKTQEVFGMEFRAGISGGIYTWSKETLSRLREELEGLDGLIYLAISGFSNERLLVEFTDDKVTIATIEEYPKINCLELDRQMWIDEVVEMLITGKTFKWMKLVIYNTEIEDSRFFTVEYCVLK